MWFGNSGLVFWDINWDLIMLGSVDRVRMRTRGRPRGMPSASVLQHEEGVRVSGQRSKGGTAETCS